MADNEPHREKYSPLEHLRFLRDNFSDRIPDRVIHSNDKDKRYKVRRNWWAGLLADLSNGLDEGVFPGHLKGEVEQFMEEHYGDEFREKPLIEAADIKKANDLLDKIFGKKNEPRSPDVG